MFAVRTKTADLVDCRVEVDALAAGAGTMRLQRGSEGRLENSAGSVYTGDGADNAIGIAGGSCLETGGIFMRGFRHCAVPGVRRINHLRGK